MSYEESAAARIREVLKSRQGFIEKRMFGGVGFLLNENMCVGLWKEFLILRVGPEKYPDLLKKRDVKEFDITGRAMAGWIMVAPGAFAGEAALRAWIDLAGDYVGALPAKSKAKKKPKKKPKKKTGKKK